MSLWEDGSAKLLTGLRGLSPTDTLGSAGVAIGVILVTCGIFLQESSVGMGGAIRMLGGVLLLSGLGAVLFGESRRRVAVIRAARRVVERYMAATAKWRWQDRVGVAVMVIGLILLAPAMAMQILFGTIFGAMVISPGIILLWVGAVLLLYKRLWLLLYRRSSPRGATRGRNSRHTRRPNRDGRS